MDYFIYQTHKDACGPICLKILAAHYFHDKRYLTIKENWSIPSSFFDLVKAASTIQLTLKGYRLTHVSLLKTIRTPMIIHLSQPVSHFIVIKKIAWNLFKVYDPGLGIQRVSLKYFQRHPIQSILIPVQHSPSKNIPFRYFDLLSMHPLFFWMTGLFLLTVGIATVIYPTFWFVTVITVVLSIFALVWLVYVIHQLSHYHRIMDQRYGHYIHHPQDFKIYHLIKADYYSIPLKYMFYCLSLSTIYGYFLWIDLLLIPGLLISTLLIAIIIGPLDQKMQEMLAKIEAKEASMVYPLKDVNVLASITQYNYQYVYLYLYRHLILIVFACVVLFVSSLFVTINGTQWILTLSLFLTSYHHTLNLLSLSTIKHKLYTMMNAFINKSNMIK